MKKTLLYGFIFLMLPEIADAQVDISRYIAASPRDSNNSTLRFERNLNTYLWNLKADYAQHNDEFSADFHDRYSSSFIRRDQNSRRDEHTVWLNSSQRLSSLFSADVEASSFILSDNQSLGVSNAALHSGLVGLSVRPISHFSFTPLVGFRFDRQQDDKDQGWNYKLLSETDTLDFGGYETQGSMRLNVSNLSPRYFRNNVAQVFMQKSFIEGSLDSLRIQWSNNRWDFYVPADSFVQKEYNVSSNIRSRVDENIGVSNSILYGIGKKFSAIVQTLIETRTIGNAYRYKSLSQPTAIPYNITVQEQRLQGGVDINYQDRDNLNGSVGVRLDERDERHIVEKIDGVDKNIQENRSQQEQRLDNTARRTTLHGSVGMPLSPGDHFSLESSAGILRYDTPDSTNNDDRDELLINLAARETHRWSEYLEMNIVAEATLSHIAVSYTH